jgi:hypothetical protein
MLPPTKPHTADVEALFEKCDPTRENLCLYGEQPERLAAVTDAAAGNNRSRWLAACGIRCHSGGTLAANQQSCFLPTAPNTPLPPHPTPPHPTTQPGDRSGNWTVAPPAEEIPAELPEPCLGVNFPRDGMNRKDWLALLAIHSDAWLMAVAFFYAVKLDASGRARLYRQLNTQPTLFEVVTGRARPTPPPAKPGWGAGGGGGAQRGGGMKRNADGTLAEGGPAPGVPSRLPPVPFKDMPASANGSKHPDPRGRRLQYEDITPRLQGKYTEVRRRGARGGGAPCCGGAWLSVGGGAGQQKY